MQITLNYGRKGFPIELPDDWDIHVIRKKPMSVIPNPASAVLDALSNPVASETLVREAKGKSSACILVCDITRPVPNALLLSAIIHELMRAGIPASGITILIATGLHRPNEGDELRELIGDSWVLKNIRIENHFARDSKNHVSLGKTGRGTPVLIDRRFIESELKIVTGLVEPHFMAGYSGGRKLITPGIAHKDTITAVHNARFLEDPGARNCNLLGNPLHEEQIEIARMIGRILAVNTVIDEHRRLSHVNFGEIAESHLAAVSFLKNYAMVPVGRRFSTVLTTGAGYPLDKTYYQTVKGMVGALDLLCEGGNLFIASECSEGLGSASYVSVQERLLSLGVERFCREYRAKAHADVDEWQTGQQVRCMLRGSVHLFSKLPPGEARLTGATPVKSLLAHLAESVERSADSSIAVIPEGPYVIPVFKP